MLQIKFTKQKKKLILKNKWASYLLYQHIFCVQNLIARLYGFCSVMDTFIFPQSSYDISIFFTFIFASQYITFIIFIISDIFRFFVGTAWSVPASQDCSRGWEHGKDGYLLTLMNSERQQTSKR